MSSPSRSWGHVCWSCRCRVVWAGGGGQGNNSNPRSPRASQLEMLQVYIAVPLAAGIQRGGLRCRYPRPLPKAGQKLSKNPLLQSSPPKPPQRCKDQSEISGLGWRLKTWTLKATSGRFVTQAGPLSGLIWSSLAFTKRRNGYIIGCGHPRSSKKGDSTQKVQTASVLIVFHNSGECFVMKT